MSISAEYECAYEMQKRIDVLQKEIEQLKNQNAKLKATNKKYCKELIEYRMIENSMQNYDSDNCFDEEDFLNL